MIKITQKVHFTRVKDNRKRIVAGPAPTQPTHPPRTPRISRVMALAITYDDALKRREVRSMVELAELAMVSQPRITYLMSLLNLAPDIQEELLFWPGTEQGRDPLTEKDLREVYFEIDFDIQRGLWNELKKRVSPPSQDPKVGS
jgi:hypothetical protein